jgi:2-polyprenyl-3-methyl-5-hydroxy-6-metoxy-1,4-benzoquinol methylase
MDQPGLDVLEHRHALTALGRANAVSRTVAAIWPAVRQAARTVHGAPLRILDIASGSGHVAVGLASRAAREGIPVEITGLDISPVAVDYARALAAGAGVTGARFEVADVANGPWPGVADVVVCCLFLHHLAEDEAAELLQRLKSAARRLVVVSDLRRSRIGYVFAWAGCRLLSRSRVFHVDGTRSVEAAFTTGEARELAMRAGLAGARVTERWPQRWLLTWEDTQG